MRNSSAGSRPRPCCPQPRPQPCCSGRYSQPVRSPCEKSMDGKPSPTSSLTSQLTSLPDPISSSNRRPRQTNSSTDRDGTDETFGEKVLALHGMRLGFLLVLQIP